MKFILAFFSLVIFSGESAFAANAGVSVRQGVVAYTVADVEVTPGGGDTNKRKVNEVETYPADLEIAVTVENLVLYAFPTSPGASLAIGYIVLDPLEIGLNLDMNSSKWTKPNDETENNLWGVYTVYSHIVGPDAIEVGFSTLFGSKKTKAEDGDGVEMITESDLTEIVVSIDYVKSIADNFDYIFGVSYLSASENEKKSRTKTSTKSFGVNLAKFQFRF